MAAAFWIVFPLLFAVAPLVAVDVLAESRSKPPTRRQGGTR